MESPSETPSPTDSGYPVKQILDRARKGRLSIYPFSDENHRFSIYGTDMRGKATRFPTLDDLMIVPPQFTPLRLEKAVDLIDREPTFHDVKTESLMGGFETALPLVQASMGSQDEWNRVACHSAKACASAGLIYGIGENVTATWGYEKRKDSSQPSFMDRVMSYLENMTDDLGGAVIQQNEEDAYNELWNRVYSDQKLDEHIQQGRIAFEIKGGQGAKAGLGGEKIIDRDTAKRLRKKHTIVPDPETVDADIYERHSAPDIFTEEILEARIKKLRNDYPRVKIWFKTGPYRDLERVIHTASRAGADCIVIDGKEGGTGMSPSVALDDLGIPTLVCLQRIEEARKAGIEASTVVSGRLYNGSHMVKALALGADAIAMGRPFLISSYAYRFAEHIIERELYRKNLLTRLISGFFSPNGKSESFVLNFIESVANECKILTSAVGKYDVKDLDKEDLGALNRKVAEMFAVDYIYANA